MYFTIFLKVLFRTIAKEQMFQIMLKLVITFLATRKLAHHGVIGIQCQMKVAALHVVKEYSDLFQLVEKELVEISQLSAMVS